MAYNQVDPDPATASPDSIRSYTIGDDVLAQDDNPLDGDTTPDTLLYDGQGSTRQLVNQAQTVIKAYSYDGYGNLLGGNPTAAPATNLLYTGEQYDSSLGQYYLRARYYDPANGRFNRLDPYAGNISDPQSLHKYLYCHGNPVNGIDPSGRMLIGGMVGTVTRIVAWTMVAVVGVFAFRSLIQGRSKSLKFPAMVFGPGKIREYLHNNCIRSANPPLRDSGGVIKSVQVI